MSNLTTEFSESIKENKCTRCEHSADIRFEWAPGHSGGLICDCCIKKVWEKTRRNITKSLKELNVRCS